MVSIAACKQRLLRCALLAALLTTSSCSYTGAFNADKPEWLVLKDTDLSVVAGSALDFSTLFLNTDPDTMLQVSGDTLTVNGQAVRFMCAPLVLNKPQGGFPPHAEADQLAQQLRMHGYNLVRFHHVESTLMEGRKGDFNYDPEQLDRLYYLMYALKRQGIRWYIDALTSWNGSYALADSRFSRGKHNLKKDIHYNPASQQHWKKMVDLLLVQKNPYTKAVIIEDTALSIITPVNELGVLYNAKGRYPKQLQARFDKWLSAKGLTPFAMPRRYESSPQAALMNAFAADLEKETLAWMRAYLRKKGFKGLVTAYNNGKPVQATAARYASDVVSLHAYHELPSEFVRQGSLLSNRSSTANRLNYLGYFALNRFLDKPFIVDEYDQPYWDSWRREAGIAMGSVAALQRWDGICRYSNPVVLRYEPKGPPRRRAMYPFEIGLDPIGRAGETLATLLYLRGDVAPARHRVAISPDGAFDAESASSSLVEAPLGWLALVTGVGLEGQSPVSADLTLPYASQRNKKALKLLMKMSGANQQIWSGYVDKLKSAGILVAGNQTDADGMRLQSDTGQVMLDVNKRMLQVHTPKTEAISWNGSTTESIGQLRVAAPQRPLLLSVSSLDNEDIQRSKRLLLIVASDAINSGSVFSEDRAELIDLGTLPVLLERVSTRVQLQSAVAGSAKVYALALNGARREEVPVSVSKGLLQISLDTASLKGGPTTFFEIVIQE